MILMMRRKKHKREQLRSRHFTELFLIFVCLLLLVVAAVYESCNKPAQERGTEHQAVGMRNCIEYNGVTYAEKTGMTTVLIIGTDRSDNNADYGARRGGQADFLLLLAIDSENQSIHQLQIDRDTITEVEVYGIFGNYIGLQPLQICLSHAFGTTGEECNERTVHAVEKLLPGLNVDICISFDLASIGLLNEAVGGVTVTLEDDFTSLDPEMSEGSTIKLNNQQAEIYVRSRMDIGDGTNRSRMTRQITYMRAAVDAIKLHLRDDPDYFSYVLDILGDDIIANVSRGRLLNTANNAYNYTFIPIVTLNGTHTIGKDGFIEFHLAENVAKEWVIRVFYEPCK